MQITKCEKEGDKVVGQHRAPTITKTGKCCNAVSFGWLQAEFEGSSLLTVAQLMSRESEVRTVQ